jgi:hypothetical protein
VAVAVGGVQVFAAEDVAAQDHVHETVGITAGGASALSLAAFNDQGHIELDNISVTASPVPEPDEVQLLLAGLLMTGITLRRRGRG